MPHRIVLAQNRITSYNVCYTKLLRAAVVFSDGVNIRYFKKGDKLPEKHQLHIEFNDGSSIACSVQMYGGLSAFKIGEYDNEYYLAAASHPSPLSDEFDFVYFKNLITVKTEKLSTKAFLATEQRIPGLGNGVVITSYSIHYTKLYERRYLL